MVFSPITLVTFVIVKNYLVAFRADNRVVRRRGQYLRNASAVNRHRIELGHTAGRELNVADEILSGSTEKDGPVIGGKAARHLAGGVKGEPFCLAAGCRHDKNVKISIAV